MDIKEEMLEGRHLAGLVLFLWASYNHHKVHKQFAQLRMDKKGDYCFTEWQLIEQFEKAV